MLKNIRMTGHQLMNPRFDSPKELVSWMGAIQAQDYVMAKWAIGIRLQSATLKEVDEALERGEIVRTHVLRPTWHLVPAEDLRWMLMLTRQRIRSANDSYAKGHLPEMPGSLYTHCFNEIEKLLEGNNHLTKQEIATGLKAAGIEAGNDQMTRFMQRAEVEGLVCSGISRGREHTYALLDERIPKGKELTREEALARLAERYFQSRCPATLADFTWWSGLTTTEAKQAIKLIEPHLFKESHHSIDFYLHETYDVSFTPSTVFHFLPSFDEYLISYKKRTDVLELRHHPKAFNSYGTFHPVILQDGWIVGNWKKVVGKNNAITINTSFFEQGEEDISEDVNKAVKRIQEFYGM